jgi:pimeloyl-ACP methyl ester carboxylesterase
MSTYECGSVVRRVLWALVLALAITASAVSAQKVVDIPTRSGVTQRMIVTSTLDPRAAAVLFAGNHGGLRISPSGSLEWGEKNFLVRTQQLFANQGLLVVLVDAPSDRQDPPYLSGFRQTPEHAADIKAVIAWLRAQSNVPVWLVGTSRGTQSVAYLATELVGPDGPDGIVLSATILADYTSRPVPAMPLGNIRTPVLVVHHEQDACYLCPFSGVPSVMEKLVNSPRKGALSFKGGQNIGDPCEGLAYHGFNGLESDVVQKITAWIFAK